MRAKQQQQTDTDRIGMRVEKPWGSWTLLEAGSGYKVKRIEVLPGKRLSLQKHTHRSEHWVVVEGMARVTNDSRVYVLKRNQWTFISLGAVHRLENPDSNPLVVIEVQNGDDLRETDIVRLEDDFGRVATDQRDEGRVATFEIRNPKSEIAASLKIILVGGARPNFMKIAPLVKALRCYPQVEVSLVHTGQHYDTDMSKIFFEELGIQPTHELGVGSGTHAAQTAEIMKRFEPICLTEHPDVVVVVGDVNSTLACTLVSSKLGIPVAHVEAGLRSFDRSMPEEINRVVTDAVADYLFTTEESANANLVREGVDPQRIFFVGNVMIDTLRERQDRAAQSGILERLKLQNGRDILRYGVVTLHRPNNVDVLGTLGGLLSALEHLAEDVPLIFPVHPRTRTALAALNRSVAADVQFKKAPARGDVLLIEPLGYLDFLRLMDQAQVVLTDSGGIQEEATVLGVPCVTLRETTERPVTVEVGMNVIAGSDPEQVVRYGKTMLQRGRQKGTVPPLWDGHASRRIAEILIRESENGGLTRRSGRIPQPEDQVLRTEA